MEYAVAFSILSMTYPHQNHACPVDWTTSIPSSILQAIQTFQNRQNYNRHSSLVYGIQCPPLHNPPSLTAQDAKPFLILMIRSYPQINKEDSRP